MSCKYPRVQVQICIDDDERLISLPYSSVKRRQAKDVLAEIIKEAGIQTSKELVLRINSQKGSSLVLVDSEYPIRICKGLIICPDEDTNITGTLMPYYLHLSVRTGEEETVLSIPVTDENDEYVYRSYVKFRRKDQERHVEMSIYKFLGELHNVQNVPIKVVPLIPPGMRDPSTGLPKTEDVRIIESIFAERCYVSFPLEESQKKLIRKRTKCVAEVIEKEERYVEKLRSFPTHVHKTLMKLCETQPGLKPEDVQKYTDYVTQMILPCHEAFYALLQKLKIGFATELSVPLKAHVEFLKLYAEYYKLYKIVKPHVEAATNNASNSNIFDQFEAAPGCETGLESIMACISQKIAQYLTNIKELIKLTPKHHPDHNGIVTILKKLDQNSKHIDFETTREERALMLKKIESKFDPPMKLQQRDRVFVVCYMAQHGKQKYEMILLSDKLVIAEITDNWRLVNPVFHDYSEVNVMEYGESSVILRDTVSGMDRNTKYLFKDKHTRKDFVDKLKRVIIQYQQTRMADQITLKWECLDTNTALAYHNMVYARGKFWIFGGKDDRGNINSKLMSMDIRNNMKRKHKEERSTDPPGRFRAAMCASEDALYLFGGTRDNKTALHDFWKFNLKSTLWEKIETVDDVWPTASLGLHMEFYDDRLLLTGGSEKFEIYQYLIAENRWERVEQDSIPPIIDHVLVRVPGPTRAKCGIIIGGCDKNGVSNNHIIMLSEYGKRSRYIKTLSLNPVNRAQCSACLNGNNIYVYGGTKLHTQLPYVLVLPTQCWTVPMCHFGGTLIPELRGAAMAAVDGVVYIHGGQSESSDIYEQMYMITNTSDDALTDDIGSQISSFEEDTYVRRLVAGKKEQEENWTPFEDKLVPVSKTQGSKMRRPTLTKFHIHFSNL